MGEEKNLMSYILSQLFGFGAFLISLTAYHKDKKKKILSTMIFSNLLNFMHYLLLGATSGCITKVIAIIRDIFVIEKKKYPLLNKKVFLYLFVFIYVLSAILTYQNLSFILPLCAALIYLVAIWYGEELRIKQMAFFTQIIWLFYHISITSIVGMIASMLSILSTYIAYQKERRFQ